MTSRKKAARVCDRHKGEAVTVFSLVQEKCMCLKCALEMHDSVSEFLAISEIVPNMKNDAKRIMTDLNTLSDATSAIRRDQMSQMKQIQAGEKQVRAAIRTVRDKLLRQLDILEQKVVKSVKQLIQESDQAYLKDHHDIQMVDTELKRIKENLTNVLKTGDNVQIVESVLVEKERLSEQLRVAKSKERKLTSKSIRFELSQTVLDFIENFQQIGEVAIVESNGPGSVNSYVRYARSVQAEKPPAPPPSSLSTARSDGVLSGNGARKPPTHRKGPRYGIHASRHYNASNHNSSTSGSLPQLEVHKDVLNNSLDTIADMQILTAEHEGSCNLSGVAALPNDRVLVCDSKHKCVQLLNKESELLDDMVFHHKPCGISRVSDDSVVVSFHDKDFISLFDVSSFRITHVRDVSVSGRGGSYSVSFCKNRFAVCRRGEVRLISSEDGSLVAAIQTEAHFPQVALSDGGSKIYLSDFVNGKVLCLDDLGKVRWEYGHEDFEPCSIALDLNQLFVADVKGNVSVLSTYGLLVRRIFCSGTLQSLCVDPSSECLLVTHESKDKLKSRTVKILEL